MRVLLLLGTLIGGVSLLLVGLILSLGAGIHAAVPFVLAVLLGVPVLAIVVNVLISLVAAPSERRAWIVCTAIAFVVGCTYGVEWVDERESIVSLVGSLVGLLWCVIAAALARSEQYSKRS